MGRSPIPLNDMHTVQFLMSQAKDRRVAHVRNFYDIRHLSIKSHHLASTYEVKYESMYRFGERVIWTRCARSLSRKGDSLVALGDECDLTLSDDPKIFGEGVISFGYELPSMVLQAAGFDVSPAGERDHAIAVVLVEGWVARSDDARVTVTEHYITGTWE
jgi:hypothetical protein